jgi:predicted dehydrogenase
MGTQIHAEPNYRRVVELVQSGAIGPVREAHAWVGTVWGKPPEQAGRPTETPPVPAGLDWDLWLGPAPERPYHSEYVPTSWRRWWDFGGGALADMGCHFIDCIFWALKLRHPLTAQAEGPTPSPECAPHRLHAQWEFPEREGMPALTLHWWDGGLTPPALPQKKRREWGNGILFVGEKGMLLANYGSLELLPEEKFADFAPPAKSIPDSIGHHNEWFEAIKGRGTTLCNFDYSGTLTETVLLGTVAFRAGERLEWDAANLKIKNSAKAQALVRREYRKGWSL